MTTVPHFVQIKKIHFLLLLVVFLVASCKKYEEETITGNQPPPDGTISSVLIENYVNKVYISVLGRKASDAEFNSGKNLLAQNNLSASSRQQFLDEVFDNYEYKVNLYEKAKIELLNNLDTTEIVIFIGVFNTLLADSAYMASWDLLQHEIDKLELMQQISIDLELDTINEIGLFKRCCNNYFYDQINMGSLNYVVSLFQHFLDRYPTDNELTEGIKMVDGGSANLFLQSGTSRNDLIQIFFSSSDYYEGQVRLYYKRYLFREPNSVEMGTATQQYISTGDYRQMQKNILSSNEYIGL